jgi:hypothetical protein
MNNLKKMVIMTFLTAVIIMLPFFIVAGAPKIVSVTMIPANPQFGDFVQVAVTMCCNKYTDTYIAIAFSTFTTPVTAGTGGQVFVVDSTGNDVKNVNETTGEMGAVFALGNGADTNTCTDCGADANSRTITKIYSLHIPSADYYSSCNPTSLNLVVVGQDSYLGNSNWTGYTACNSNVTSFPIVAPTKSFQITKRYEGVLQNADDEILFAIDYSYANGAGFSISDPIPAGFTVLSYGPTSIPGGSVTAPGATAVWNFPDRTGVAGVGSGTVWVLCQMTGTPSGNYTNTATGSMTGLSNQTSSVTVSTGQAAISITKDESATSVLSGNNITYTLSYDINGMQLKNFQAFDNNPTGTYCPSGCTNSTPPTGWKFLSNSGNYGTWTVSDPCGTGGHYVTGASTMYPALLLDDGSSANNSDQFCTGEIVADFYINPGTFPGADAQIIIRNNGIDGGSGYSLGIVESIDNAPAPGYFMLQECAGTACSYPAGGMPGIGAVSAAKWYRVRILASGPDGDHIQARIWARGDPEPTTWDIDYTGPELAAGNWICDGTGTYTDWRPGVNEQTGSTNDVKDSYDNFTVYLPRTTDSAFVDDTVPTNISYLGCNGCASSAPVLWNIGTVQQQSGSFTWWGKVTGCGTVSNQGLIGSAGNQPVLSNWVSAAILCWSPTFTPTPTFTITNTVNPSTPTFTPTRTATPTFTSTRTNTPTFTYTPTYTPTSTSTNTPTFTPTYTQTSTYTPSSTRSNTPTFTNTNTYTPTFTPSYTYTNSPSPSFTPTDTPTYTASSTKTATPTFTDTKTVTQTVTETNTISSNTPTATPTFTDTPTNTPTFTDTPTNTSTFTQTNTVTDTPTRTNTTSPTFTPTDTPTFTQTSTFTDTPTYTNTTSPTFTPTDTPTYTQTDTYTMTYTSTNTPTYTPTYTDTPVNSATDTPTYTATNTASPTSTDTYTMTDTPTFTYTRTDTPTFTMTDTPTSTYTATPTFTPTYTFTNTPTITPTQPPFPYTILIGVYNSAGELVKTIASEPASNLFTTVDFSVGTNSNPSSMLPGQLLDIYIPNLMTPNNEGAVGTLFTWDGTTNGQQPVASGSYYIKLQQVDTYNHVSVLIKQFSFLQEQQFVELLVYNSAGEVVYDSKQYTNLAPTVVTLKLADIIPVQKSGNNNIQVIYGPALTDYISWNGKNNDGDAVGSGTYEIKILSQTLEGTVVTASKTVVVLSEGSKYLDNIKAYPNPYTGTGVLTFAWTSGETGIITIKIYNISGEMVRSLTGNLAAGTLTWDCKTGSGYNVSQGYYVAVLSATDSEGYVNYKTVKFAITNKP